MVSTTGDGYQTLQTIKLLLFDRRRTLKSPLGVYILRECFMSSGRMPTRASYTVANRRPLLP